MLKDDDKIYCDNCEELVEDNESVIFIDAPDGGGEFCSWSCVAEYASK